VYHLLAAMAAHGFVVHLPHDRRWGLGTAAFELAGGYARQQPLALGRPLVAALSDRLGESTHVAVMTGRDVLYIVEERARGAPRSSRTWACGCRLTSRRRDAMLAALPREQVRALYPDAAAFADRTGRGRGARPSCASCCVTRAAGFAGEDGEVTLGFRSVAVAVRDHAGWPVAAIAVTWPAEAGHTAEALAPAVTTAADELQRRLYG
jgi:DNA-binding IclR family transcriptional regulator